MNKIDRRSLHIESDAGRDERLAFLPALRGNLAVCSFLAVSAAYLGLAMSVGAVSVS